MADEAICKIEGCRNPVLNLQHGWCSKHYQRWNRNGDPLKSKIDREHSGEPCSVDGCDIIRSARGLCEFHYDRWSRTGDPLVASLSPAYLSNSKWLKENSTYLGEDCLKWPFAVGDHGRGVAVLNGVSMSAPRAMCILAHGSPPTPAHQASHICGKGHEGCMNPRHLRWATPKENEADKRLHGTLRRGGAINTAKLTETEVKEIRSARGDLAAIARQYGITPQNVCVIKARKTWAWLD